jgi:hypothetical protein
MKTSRAREEVTMSPRKPHSVATILCLLVLLGASAGCASAKRSAKEGRSETTLTAEQLQSALMSFADLFALSIVQSADKLEDRLEGSEARNVARERRYFTAAAAYTIAAGPNPEIALLDMLVLVSMERRAVESHWLPNVFGEAGEELLGVLRQLETEVWTLADTVLTPEQHAQIESLISEWTAEHPRDWRWVSFRRLGDVAEERMRAAAATRRSSKGIFSSFKKALTTAEESRLLAERSMYYLQRLPFLVSWQVQYQFNELGETPVVQQTLANANVLTDSMEIMARQVDELDELIEAQRSAIFEQAESLLASERERLLETLESEEVRLRGLLGEVRSTLEVGSQLAAQVDSTVSTVDALTERLDLGPADGEPFDLAEVRGTLVDATTTVEHLSQLAESVDRILTSPGWEERLPEVLEILDRVEEGGGRLVDRAFWRLLILVLVTLVGTVLVIVAYRLAARR